MPKFRIIFVVAKKQHLFSCKIALLLLELTYFFPQERRRRWRDTSNDGLLGHICNPFCSALRAWPSPVLTTKFCHLKGIEQTREGGRMKKPCEGEIISTLSFLWSDPRVGVESLSSTLRIKLMAEIVEWVAEDWATCWHDEVIQWPDWNWPIIGCVTSKLKTEFHALSSSKQREAAKKVIRDFR